MRILHVFGRLGMGGAETWLMNVFRRIDRDRFAFDFLLHQSAPGEFDDEARSLGATLHIIDCYRQPLRYAAALRTLLARQRYDAVHSHVYFHSGYVLALARLSGVPGRIAHSHTSVPESRDSLLRTAYKRTMRAALFAAATHGLGCSGQACQALYGPRWREVPRYEVLLYGYDFSRFADVARERSALGLATRRALGLLPDDFVVGHIGRFVAAKNHPFLVDVMTASKARGRTDEKFVLVGDGEDRPAIEHAVHQRGLADRCVFTGQRSDIPALLSAFDVLVLPSLWEGLGITVLEAQACGVKCLVSDRVPAEAVVIDRITRQVAIDRAEDWLYALDDLRARPALPAERALAAMIASPFGIDQHMARIAAVYNDVRTTR